MLISLLIASLLLHGGGAAAFSVPLEQTSKLIKKEVTDEAAKKQALAIVDQASQANKTFMDERKKGASAISKVLSERTATADQIQAAFQPLIADDSVASEKMVDATIQLKSVLSASDWSKVFMPPPPPPKK